MPFTIQLSGFTLGASILNVDLYACTGSLAQCTEGTLSSLTNYFPMVGYSNIRKTDLNGLYVVVPNDIKRIKVKVSNTNDGGCVECTDVIAGDYCNLIIVPPNTPTPTPTPTTTPTPTPTVTPTPTIIPCSFDGTVVYVIPSTPTPTPTITVTSTPTPTPTVTPTPTPTVIIYSGDIWFGNTPSTGFDGACSGDAHQEYLFWSGSQELYQGLVFYTDSGLLYPWSNSLNQYSYCRSDGAGGGRGEMNLSGNVVGAATGTLC